MVIALSASATVNRVPAHCLLLLAVAVWRLLLIVVVWPVGCAAAAACAALDSAALTRAGRRRPLSTAGASSCRSASST